MRLHRRSANYREIYPRVSDSGIFGFREWGIIGRVPFTALGYRIIPTPQIALQTKQFCLGNSSCGISIIHFVLYCTWLLMLRYHFVSTFDNELCNLWRQYVPGGLLLIWYYSADFGGVKCSSNILNIQVSIGISERIFNCCFYFYNLIVALFFRFKCLFKRKYETISYIIRYFRYFKIIKEIRS